MYSKQARWVSVVVISALVAASAGLLWASGVGGCFAIVEKVVLEPNDAAPERIQIWGAFAMNDGKPGLGYLAPKRGYMYFSIPAETALQLRQGVRVPQRNIALVEWNDLKHLAGSGKIVSFAERTTGLGPAYWTARIHGPSEKPESPESYPLYNGITVVPESQLLTPAIVSQLQDALKKK